MRVCWLIGICAGFAFILGFFVVGLCALHLALAVALCVHIKVSNKLLALRLELGNDVVDAQLQPFSKF